MDPVQVFIHLHLIKFPGGIKYLLAKIPGKFGADLFDACFHEVKGQR
jgi:hypothetical protein